jgi:hypothetical protein
VQFDRARILHALALAAVELRRSCGRNIARVVREGVRMRPALHTLIRANMCAKERKKLYDVYVGYSTGCHIATICLEYIILLFDVAVVEASRSE